jgi:EpsI family protein
MLIAAASAWFIAPQAQVTTQDSLAAIVPTEVGEWKEYREGSAPVDPTNQAEGERTMKSPYDDVLMRAYRNGKGETILLAIAYGREQRQEIKIHRPELCYVAQGFGVLRQSRTRFPPIGPGEDMIAGQRVLVGGPRRIEAVSYWIRIGDRYSDSAWHTRGYIFAEGLKGRVVDGLLMRVSQILPDAESASPDRYVLQEQFAAELVRAVPARQRHLLAVRQAI